MDRELNGTWQMVRAELSGEAAPDLVTQHTRVSLVDGSYEIRYGGGVTAAGRFEVETAEGAKTLWLHGTSGENAARSIPCLYQLRGDRLRVCFGLDGIRPAEFATRPGEPRYLATYRRTEPAD